MYDHCYVLLFTLHMCQNPVAETRPNMLNIISSGYKEAFLTADTRSSISMANEPHRDTFYTDDNDLEDSILVAALNDFEQQLCTDDGDGNELVRVAQTYDQQGKLP